MKPIKNIIPFLCFWMLAIVAVAETKPQTGKQPILSKDRIRLIREKTSHVTQRPKAPSRQLVSCEYDGQNLLFEFELPEGMCELVLTDVLTAQTTAYVFDSSTCNAAVYVGEIYESTLTLTTSLGNVYSGTFSSTPK